MGFIFFFLGADVCKECSLFFAMLFQNGTGLISLVFTNFVFRRFNMLIDILI